MKLKIVYREINKAETWFFREKNYKLLNSSQKMGRGRGRGEKERGKYNVPDVGNK